MPKVRIVADYCSPGYQLADEEARASASCPVSTELLDNLARWSNRYERCHPQDYEEHLRHAFRLRRLRRRSLEIAKAVKRALPAWTVLYWDELLDWFLAREPRSYNPARSEYEITLNDALATRPVAPACGTQRWDTG